MKKLLPLFFIAFSVNQSFAQQEFSSFTSTGRGVSTTFVTDYQTIGINPANLGLHTEYETKHVTLGLMEGAASAYSNALSKTTFGKSLTEYNDIFNQHDKIKAAQQFAGNGVAANVDLMALGFAIQSDKLGGFAFSIKESMRWYSQFSGLTADLLFRGKTSAYFDQLKLNNGEIVANDPSQYEQYEAIGIDQGMASNQLKLSALFDGSKIKNNWYREYNLNYGRKVFGNDLLYITAGVGVKYLQGFNYTNCEVKNGKIVMAGAFNPYFEIDFGVGAANNPSAINNENYQSIGNGFGFDFGADVVINEKITIGAAITNIGSINYTGNVYTIKDTTLASMASEGSNNYNIFSQAPNILAKSGTLKWEGQKNIKAKLPTMFRLGASIRLIEIVNVGFDFIMPTNKEAGNFEKPYIGVGGDIKPIRWIRLSTGINTGGNYISRANVPFGLTIVVGENGTWELGAATRDIVTYLRQKGPNLSFAFGFLRFRL
ncbi:DUF5723 family protein [Sporocytophaga myxococcoides]|uniref:DUF5723 family protein n=1 Tax=Sporocytophaga myxococcoides TaxID=153721 RepID=UPI0003FF41D2|nr:DUF5723 family protein [Sporocytophaga myxococcoides]